MDVQSVRKCMSRNKYLEIKRYLHITDNSYLEGIPENERDKLFKICPLIDKLNENFQQFGVFSESLNIDERMVRYFRNHYLKQFMRGKPVRFGFKQWAICCSQTGYCYQMQVYEGKATGSDDDAGMSGLGASVVLKMISILETPYAHKIYFDDFFTGFSLMKYLKDIDVRATGTARFNRMNKCPIAPDKEMKKKERGKCDYRFDSENEILGVIWNDNSCVKLLSNHEPIDPMSQVNRWSRKNKREIQVPQPKLITEYNRHMGGVDKMDRNVQKYRIKVRGKKWYFPLLTNAIDVALVNSHALYCLANGAIPLLDFRTYVARAYLALSSRISDPKKAGRKSFSKPAKSHVPVDIRTSGTGHYIECTEMGKQRKCAVCKTNARKQCCKCNVELHVECFPVWHQN
ncbi:piggyBac transposable element-derived protein 3-like [Erpetoichthys calabaricus]|uniref:piggyBac transposable element-derived protein 3-like n=1 Tax=Erpetoichthys calabaricus TaxID=27687 RepID=UPI0010A071AD|nr:piggyBac transposable element-derived protein 3-like [Erpetoichthys calabaricus]